MNEVLSARPMEAELSSTLNISLPIMRTASGLGMAFLMTMQPSTIPTNDLSAPYETPGIYDQAISGSSFRHVDSELGSSWSSTHYIGNLSVTDVELAQVAQSVGKMISEGSQSMDPDIRAAFSATRAQHYL